VAEEAYIVAFDIQEAGSGYQVNKPTALLGAKEEATIGLSEAEGNGTTEPGLFGQGIKSSVARCMLAEVKAGSAAEAVEVVRLKYAQNAGGERAVAKPNKTNFKMVA
jgi:hypothetical protein